MLEDADDIYHYAVIALVVVICVSGLGSCVYDIYTAQPLVAEVTVVDKHYEPEHWTVSCSHYNKHTHCHPVYHAPEWTASYEEGTERHWTSVSSGTFDTLHIGDRRWLRYEKGGYWGFRYGETFLLAKPDGERW